MTKRTKLRASIKRVGQTVPVLRAALIAVEADRLGVLPRKVRRVEIPDPAPTHVVIARQTVSVQAAAILAEEADARGLLLETLVTQIVHEAASGFDRRAKRRRTRKSLAEKIHQAR